jgi:preprotein translocase subunit YajC
MNYTDLKYKVGDEVMTKNGKYGKITSIKREDFKGSGSYGTGEVRFEIGGELFESSDIVKKIE